MKTLALALVAVMMLAPCALAGAVEKYREAFARVEKIPEEEAKNFDQVDAFPTDVETAKFCWKYRGIMQLLQDAAKEPTADWGEYPADGQLPQSLNVARQTAWFALLHSRDNLSRGNPDAAVDDLMVTLSLGRHVGQQKVFITRLVEIGIEALAIEQLAKFLPLLSKDVVAKIPAKLEALPKKTTWAETVMAEFDFGVRATRAAGSAVGIAQAAEPFYQGVAEAGDLGPKEFAAKVDAESIKVAANPIARPVVPVLRAAKGSLDVDRTKMAMLRTAIDVALNGPDAVKKSKDPFGDGPFDYRAKKNGFELSSQLTRGNERVKLVVGAD